MLYFIDSEEYNETRLILWEGHLAMKKIVMFIGGIETTEYFTKQMEKTFIQLGHSVFLFQLENEEEEITRLCEFIERGNTVMVTFNFHGLNNEKVFYQDGKLFWEEWEIPCYNIMLDHPFYYHRYLSSMPPLYYNLCIDQGHDRYIERFFPEIKRGPLLPLAGTEVLHKKIAQRSMDIVMTGHYTPPSKFEKHITRIDEEYTQFYYRIIHDLIDNPGLGMEQAFEKHLKLDMPYISDQDLLLCMEKMIFIDLYVRFYFRGEVVKVLVDHGFKVHVVGSGWELLECEHPENIIHLGAKDSLGCLNAIADSKLSLNVMPWFKEGAHDRVFNSMVNGAVCISDESLWMSNHLREGEEIIFYRLNELNKLPTMVEGLLKDIDKMQLIADRGYQKAKEEHTWAVRAEELLKLI
jgi:hypothetical protein